MLDHYGGIKSLGVQNTAIQTLLPRWVEKSVDVHGRSSSCTANEDGLGSGIVGSNSSSKLGGLQTKTTKAVSGKTWARVKRKEGDSDILRCSDVVGALAVE